jgi:hypothetical protein
LILLMLKVAIFMFGNKTAQRPDVTESDQISLAGRGDGSRG